MKQRMIWGMLLASLFFSFSVSIIAMNESDDGSESAEDSSELSQEHTDSKNSSFDHELHELSLTHKRDCFKAIEDNDIEALITALTFLAPSEINAALDSEKTLLMEAVEQGFNAAIPVLIEAGADIYFKPSSLVEYYSPDYYPDYHAVFLAVLSKNYDGLKLLLKFGQPKTGEHEIYSECRHGDYGEEFTGSAIDLAAYQGDIGVLAPLMGHLEEIGGSPGISSLFAALYLHNQYPSLEIEPTKEDQLKLIVSSLINAGVKISEPSEDHPLYPGCTPLAYAILKRQIAVVDLLLSSDKNKENQRTCLANQEFRVGEFQGNGVELAAYAGNPLIIEKLMILPTTQITKELIGFTINTNQLIADLVVDDSCRREFLEYLLTHCSTDELNSPFEQENGRTLAHAFAHIMHASPIKLFIKLGGSVNVTDNKGKKPLHISARRADTQAKSAVRALLESEQNINIRIAPFEGPTPLYYAATEGTPEVCALLLQEGANYSQRVRGKDGRLTCAQEIIENVDPAQKGNDGLAWKEVQAWFSPFKKNSGKRYERPGM